SSESRPINPHNSSFRVSVVFLGTSFYPVDKAVTLAAVDHLAGIKTDGGGRLLLWCLHRLPSCRPPLLEACQGYVPGLGRWSKSGNKYGRPCDWASHRGADGL